MIINYQNFSLSLFDNRYQNASHIHIHTIKNPHNISTIYRHLGVLARAPEQKSQPVQKISPTQQQTSAYHKISASISSSQN